MLADGLAAAGPSSSPSTPTAASPPTLSKRMSSRNALNNTYHFDGPISSPPRTPKPKHRTINKAKDPARAKEGREEALKRLGGEEASDSRHSHGLSWSSTTRDSVVDNLLLSLDNLSPQDKTSMELRRNDDFVDIEKYRVPQSALLSGRSRGHTYSSSLSSGYDNYADSPTSMHSGTPKGRRSNSSSNVGTTNHINETSTQTRKMAGPGRTSSDTVQGKRGHTQSDSSDMGSTENGYTSMAEASRLNWAGQRSASMDHVSAESHPGNSVLDRGRPLPSVHSRFASPDDMNTTAAPEPMIPAGPRRMQNPSATGPVYVNAAPPKSHNLRKTNTQSDLRLANKALPIPQDILEQASDFVHANSMRGVPSMPLPLQHNAPAPSPGFQSISRKDAPLPHQERPGFFRRVFGGNNYRTPSGMSDRSDAPDPSHNNFDKTAPSMQSSIREAPSIDNGPKTALQTSKDQTSNPPPALTKKPSSFFRRRKKSASDIAPPPPVPVKSGFNVSVRGPEPSPSLSSLRKVMDPYLRNVELPTNGVSTEMGEEQRPTTHDSATEDSDDLDIFHSGYTSPPEASLGKRNPMSRERPPQVGERHNHGESPKMKIKTKKRQPATANGGAPTPAQYSGATSFLKDDSNGSSTATIGELAKSPSGPLNSLPLRERPAVIDTKEEERPTSRASTGDRIIASLGNSPIEASDEMRTFSAGTNISIDPNDDGWVLTLPAVNSHDRPTSKKSARVYLRPTEAEERGEQRKDSNGGLSLTDQPRIVSQEASVNGPQTTSLQSPKMLVAAAMPSPVTPSTLYHSATSLPLPSVHVEGEEVRDSSEIAGTALPPVMAESDAWCRERARKIYEGNEEYVTKSEAAAWLGEKNDLSMRTLEAYMQLSDFTGLDILSALRLLAGKLLLKGETQQFDRIITAMSARWCECNPNHGFKAQDVVHTICYSLILLNTDLHLADIGEKMSKNAYVKNTLPTIRRVVADAAPGAFDDTVKQTPQHSRPSLPWMDLGPARSTSPTCPPPDASDERTSFENDRPGMNKRLSMRPGVIRSESDGVSQDSSINNASNALVRVPWTGTMKGWEAEIETMLKLFFSSIRNDPLPLVGGPVPEFALGDRYGSVPNFTMLKRTGSIVSKAPSDNMSYRSGPGFRTVGLGWQGRNNRSRPKLYPASNVGSSRTSFDDGNSGWSPAQSSNWSRTSFARTLTSASVGNLGYHLSPPGMTFKHSIGFASALSQAIIREESMGGAGEEDSISVPGNLLEDETLTLEGAPWAKEGLVKHKHHLETSDRKAKERNWNDVFAVISKGKLTLFNFSSTTKAHSMGRKSHGRQTGRAASLAPTKVGGGDWMENAEQLEVFVLRQTIASTLPPPGYSKARPYVWALSLPDGGVHLFHVGTPQIAQEFISTANYWSARLSKEPLSGSVSNIDYGWSNQVINTALVERKESVSSPPPSIRNRPNGHVHTSSGGGTIPRPSYQSSMRGSFDTGFGNAKAKLAGDKTQIAEWHPPTQSMMASQLLEVDQLRALQTYVRNVETELARHNELKHAIELAYSPRHANHSRAMGNWQRKSEYLLREIVKFQTYVESLQAAQKAESAFYAKRTELERAGKGGVSPVDSGRVEDRETTPRAPQTPA